MFTTVAITHEPGVIIDAGHQLALMARSASRAPPNDVELPQLHRGIALPAPVPLAFVILLLGGLNQAVTYQDPVDGGPGRHRG